MWHDGDKLNENAMLTVNSTRTLGKRSRNHLTDGSINYNQNKRQIIRQTKMMLQYCDFEKLRLKLEPRLNYCKTPNDQ